MFNVSNAKPSTPKRLMTSYEVEKYVKKIGSQLQSPFEVNFIVLTFFCKYI